MRCSDDAGYRRENNCRLTLCEWCGNVVIMESEFIKHRDIWSEATQFHSSAISICMHPSYQRIIGMGKPVLPLIFKELAKSNGHWYWALKAITGEDPVKPKHSGRMIVMRHEWLKWGRVNGYLPKNTGKFTPPNYDDGYFEAMEQLSTNEDY